jgi:hypothetical protein
MDSLFIGMSVPHDSISAAGNVLDVEMSAGETPAAPQGTNVLEPAMRRPSLYQRGSGLMPRIRVGPNGWGPIIRMAEIVRSPQ